MLKIIYPETFKVEINLQELKTSYDWASIFGEENTHNCNACVESIDGTDCSAIDRNMVEKIICCVNGENEGNEWVGLFLLKDGRYLCASGSCDYTGWDCQAGNSLNVASSLDNLILYGQLKDKDISWMLK